MPNYKEIARLKAAGQSNRAIAEALGLARNTVNSAVARIEDSGLIPRYLLICRHTATHMENGTALGILTGPKVKDRTYMKLSTGYLQAQQ